MTQESQDAIKAIGEAARAMLKEATETKARLLRAVAQCDAQEQRAAWVLDQLTVVALEASCEPTTAPLVLTNGGNAA